VVGGMLDEVLVALAGDRSLDRLCLIASQGRSVVTLSSGAAAD